jgi:hypothetical protein
VPDCLPGAHARLCQIGLGGDVAEGSPLAAGIDAAEPGDALVPPAVIAVPVGDAVCSRGILRGAGSVLGIIGGRAATNATWVREDSTGIQQDQRCAEVRRG